MVDPDDPDGEEADAVGGERRPMIGKLPGQRAMTGSGTARLRASRVIATAKTPSLNASSLPPSMALPAKDPSIR